MLDAGMDHMEVPEGDTVASTQDDLGRMFKFS